MRILHTSDWHLGKHLEAKSRLAEQKMFLDELCEICENNAVDMILVCGDVFDTYNPPAEAEKLFYAYAHKLCGNGERPIVIIAGNHDSNERLIAASPLANEMGITILSEPRIVEIEIKNEKTVIACMPYPSDKRLNELISDKLDESGIQVEYSKKIGEYFKKLEEDFKDDAINIAAGHFYIAGGETSDSERDITLGGAYAVNPRDLPKNAKYLAMGHLHRAQKVPGGYYSGSPIQYSKSETGYAKCVLLVDAACGCEPEVTKIYLKNYKPIEIVKAYSAAEAISRLNELSDKECYVYLELNLSTNISGSELKEIRGLKDDIVQIELNSQGDMGQISGDYAEKTIDQEFVDFYRAERGTEPSGELVTFFKMIAGEDEE